jgi:hypothetical protein
VTIRAITTCRQSPVPGFGVLLAEALEVRAGKVVQQHVEVGREQILPPRLQMAEQLVLVIKQAVQAAIEPILGGHRFIHVQQLVHRRAAEPMPMHAELAAGLDETVDHQQLEHLGPGHVLFALGQAHAPEAVELQLPPKLACQPAVAEGPRAEEEHLAHPDLHGVERVGGYAAVIGEQAHGLRLLAALAHDRERLAPGRLLGVVDLAEVEHLALEHLAAWQPPGLDDAEVSMLLAVLTPLACLEVHARDDPARPNCLQWGWSTLQGF